MTKNTKRWIISAVAGVVILTPIALYAFRDKTPAKPATDASVVEVAKYLNSEEGRSIKSSERKELQSKLPTSFAEVQQLPEDQRRNVGRAAMEARVQQNMDAFFAAKPGPERTKVIDKQIDEFQARMKEIRAAFGDRQRPPGDGNRPEGERGDGNREGRGDGRGGWGGGSPADRQARTEYMGAMRARMQERGIDMPFGGGRGGRDGNTGGGDKPK